MGRTLRLLHLRQLRRQPLRALLAILAIAAGVTLTVAVLEARGSLNGSFRSFHTSLGGPATLRISSRYDHGGIDGSVLDTVARVDGVQAAVPLVTAVTQVFDSHGGDHLTAAIGADCRAEALFGAIGCDPNSIANASDNAPPLIGPSLHTLLGADGFLRSDVGDARMNDAVVVPQLEQINGGLVAVYPLPVAQRLFARPNGLDAIFIVPKPGVVTADLQARLAPIVGPQNRVVAADDPGAELGYLTGQLFPFMLLISLFGLAVGGQLVYNTMALSLEERRRELAIETALGGTPRTVVGGVLAEAALLGLGGGALGIVFGILAAGPFVASISHYAEQVAGVHLVARADLTSVVAAFVIAIGASVAAAVFPARRASRLDIALELADRAGKDRTTTRVHPRRVVILLALCTIGLVAAWFGSRDGALEPWQPMVLTIGILLAWPVAFALGPSLAPFVIGPIERRRIVQRGPASMALTNVAHETRRTTTLLTAIASAVGLAATLGSVVPGMADSAAGFSEHIGAGRVMVTTLSPNNTSSIDSKVSPEIEAKLAALPGVAGVEHQRWAAFDFPGVGLTGIQSTDGIPPTFSVYRGVDGAEAYRRGEVMVGPALARTLDLHPGSPFTVPGRTGPVTLVVGGIWAAPDSQGKSISAPPALFAQVVGVRPTAWLFARPQANVTPAQLAATIRAANLAPNVRVWDPDDVAAQFGHDIQGFLTPFWLLARGMLIVAFIATSSTLLLAAVKRRSEHGLLAAIGMAPGDLGRMVLIEAGIIGVLGTLSGLVGGFVGLAGFSMGSATLTGLNIPFHVSLSPVIIYGTLATAIAVVGAALPAWRTSRLDPVIALRYE